MLKQIKEYLLFHMIDSKVITEEESCYFNFGFDLLLEMLLNVITIFSIAVIMNKFVELFVFFVFFSLLRFNAGGLHLKNKWSCYILSTLIFLCVANANKHFAITHSPSTAFIEMLIWFLLIIFLWLVSPVGNVNKHLDTIEVSVYKKRARTILVFYSILFFLSMMMGIQLIHFNLLLCVGNAGISSLIGMLGNHHTPNLK